MKSFLRLDVMAQSSEMLRVSRMCERQFFANEVVGLRSGACGHVGDPGHLESGLHQMEAGSLDPAKTCPAITSF